MMMHRGSWGVVWVLVVALVAPGWAQAPKKIDCNRDTVLT
jgi:hypothetical protein